MIAVIDFTRNSREFALSTKEILLFHDNILIGKRPYSQTDVTVLLKAGWFVWDKTINKEVSEDSIILPKTHLILGRLQLHRIEGLLK